MTPRTTQGLKCAAVASLLGAAVACGGTSKEPRPEVNETTTDAGRDDDDGGAASADDDATETNSPVTVLLHLTDNVDGLEAPDRDADRPAGDLSLETGVDWSQVEGDPRAGSLELQIPFDDFDQFVDFQFILPEPRDLSGDGELVLRLLWAEGFSQDEDAPGEISFYAKSGDNWDYGESAWQPIETTSKGEWREYSFAVEEATSASSDDFYPPAIRSFGFKISTGAGEEGAKLPTPALFYVDSVGYRGGN